MARHRSVGAEEKVVVSQDNEPTVLDEGENSPYQVGITQPEQCYEADGEVSQGAAERSLEADGFCSSLVYNANGPEELEVVSAPDQDIPKTIGGAIETNPIATFDAVRVDPVGVPGGLTLCTPLCDGFLLPGGNQRHQLFYDTVSETGLTHDSETTQQEQRNNRRNYFSAGVAYSNAGQVVQQQTGAWEMNGWARPSVAPQFVAFVEDANQNPIDPERLSEIVQGSNLPGGAQTSICGYSVDLEVESSKDTGVCEIEFSYLDNGDSATRGDFKGYGDRCKSPTYTCNAASQPAWRTLPCILCTNFGSAHNTQTPGATFFPANDKYRTYHFVVAPNTPECPAQEPRVSFSNQDGSSAPYLAHDLDVYTPITRVSGVGVSQGPVSDYANSVADGPVDTVLDTVADNTDIPPAVEDALDQAIGAAGAQINATNALVNDAQNQTTGDLIKPVRMEPNANPAENPLADTSQSLSGDGLTRSLDGACERATSSESPDTVDPWVDLIDSQLTFTTASPTLYGNTAPNQDDDNNPGPARVTTGGNVGLFTDKNDDGDYDRSPDDPYKPVDILNTGAYSMLWDMTVSVENGDPQPTTDGACELGADNRPLSEIMTDMGYGVNTGLFQLVYLQEPTVVDSNVAAVQDRTAYTSGNNIYLLASQSVRTLWDGEVDPGVAGDPALDNEVDEALRELTTYVNEEVDGVQDPKVVVPGDEFGFVSDYDPQCSPGDAGEFDSKLSFTHDCQALACEGDTVVTQYVFEITNADGALEDADTVPSFSGLSDSTSSFSFGPGLHTWTDVDPLDGNPERNDDGTERPPT